MIFSVRALTRAFSFWVLFQAGAAIAAPVMNPSFVKTLTQFQFTQNTAKKTVCTVTINSSDEKNEFLRALPKSKFDFVEFVPKRALGEPAPEDTEAWFGEACESRVSCDVLLISGHFGGEFFGSSGSSLSLETLNKKSCSAKCPGILNAPKEVFLFGCNTLAGKKPSDRTPEQYLQILLNDNIDHDQAVQVVESRYGEFSVNFIEKMRRIFSNVPKIYGFDYIGPSGKNVKAMVREYLAKIGDYSAHIDRLSDRAKGSKFVNTALAGALRNTSFAQCSGLRPEDPAYELAKKLCRLNDESISIAQRVKEARALFARKDRAMLLLDLVDFVKNNSGAEVQAFKDEMTREPGIRFSVRNMIAVTSAPGLLYYWLKIADTMEWLSHAEVNEAFSKRVLGDLIQMPVTEEKFYLMLTVISDENVDSEHRTNLLSKMTPQHLASQMGYFTLVSAGAVTSEEVEDANMPRLFAGAMNYLRNWNTQPVETIRYTNYFLSAQYEQLSDAQKSLAVSLNTRMGQTSDKLFMTFNALQFLNHIGLTRTSDAFVPRILSMMPTTLSEVKNESSIEALKHFFGFLSKAQCKMFEGVARSYLNELARTPSLTADGGRFEFLAPVLKKVVRP